MYLDTLIYIFIIDLILPWRKERRRRFSMYMYQQFSRLFEMRQPGSTVILKNTRSRTTTKGTLLRGRYMGRVLNHESGFC